VLDGVSSGLGDAHLQVEDAGRGEAGPAGPPLHEQPGFGELARSARMRRRKKPGRSLGPELSGIAFVALQGASGLIEVGKHASVRVRGQPGDLGKGGGIAVGRYYADPALPLYLRTA